MRVDTVDTDLNTDAEVVFFVSSSGHCSLDCRYCIINPIVKHNPSLTYEDLKFLIDKFKKKAYFAFSGKGDFFAGYKKTENLLAKLLEHDVEVTLDINGVMIHEFPVLPASSLNKIRLINLTMHYNALKEKNALRVWKNNAKILIEKKGDNMLLGFIISSPERDLWDEALTFFENDIFNLTGKKVTLIKDVNIPYEQSENDIRKLNAKYGHFIEEVCEFDFSTRFKNVDHVICPAGKTYYRIWNDGRVEGCPNISELGNAGNVKERVIHVRDQSFLCSQPNYCDCSAIEWLGKMEYEE